MTQQGRSARSAEHKASPLFELAIVRPFTPHAMDDRLQQNKQTVIAFYDLMFNACRPAAALERYAGAIYTHPMWPTASRHSSNTSRGWLASIPASVSSFVYSQIPICSILVRPGDR